MGLHKMMHTHEIVLYHQIDEVNGKPVDECWLLDGISKKRGEEAGLPGVGWSWLRGHVGGGIWETKDILQARACVDRGVKCLESKSLKPGGC